MSGFGRFVFQDRTYYLGQMNGGLFHGRGMMFQEWSGMRKDGEWEYGSFVPANKPSEEQRQQNLQKWDAYQNELLVKHQEVLAERKRKEEEEAIKIDAAWNAFQDKRDEERPNETPANFVHRVDHFMMLTHCDKMITMYDFADQGVTEIVEGDDNYNEISDVPTMLIAYIQKQSTKSVTVPDREPAEGFINNYVEEVDEYASECEPVDPDNWQINLDTEMDFSAPESIYFSELS